MSEIIYNKLVRNDIPDIIQASGDTPVVRILDEGEIEQALLDKLAEETAEFIQAEGADRKVELGDMQQALDDLKIAAGYTLAQIQRAQRAKAEERGTFNGRIFLVKVISKDTSTGDPA